jgi:predicted RNA-binding Zn-ribbon protein involved in translation (DUF1610 family)
MSSASLQDVLVQQAHLDGNPQQRKVLSHLKQCQTAALDGYEMHCDDCGKDTVRYHSCRDRHCPRCGYRAQQRWSERMQAVALPVTYYHVVFTIPHTLNGWATRYPRLLYQTLFESVWATMKQFGLNKKQLSGDLGMTAVLHTWGQQLNHHVHLHCLVPGGVLTQTHQWHPAKGSYLFPVKALSKVYRGKMVAALRKLCNIGAIKDSQCNSLLNQIMQQDWVVYSKPCIQSTKTVVQYLARYSHRVALNDSRILSMDAQHVVLKYKDYRDNKHKTLQLTHQQLIARFSKHILPKGLMRIRHYGTMANRNRQRTRRLILTALERKEEETVDKDKQITVQEPAYYCPSCGGHHIRVSAITQKEVNVLIEPG